MQSPKFLWLALAAGFVDGRQLDEITVLLAGDAAIAIAAL